MSDWRADLASGQWPARWTADELADYYRMSQWDGGKCPVDDLDHVECRFADGAMDRGYAKEFYWGRTYPQADIVAYRINGPRYFAHANESARDLATVGE